METADTKVYVKHQSFSNFISLLNTDMEFQRQRVLTYLQSLDDISKQPILVSVLADLTSEEPDAAEFKLTIHIADEISKIDDEDIGRYLTHRYRYDVYPRRQQLDSYPPYLQIEPTSICNYRCIFCYQTDKAFTQKNSGFMGSMTYDLFKDIIDQCEGNIEFFSLASRGEPMICKDIDKMLEYCVGKFLGLKINTNASLFNEAHCHAILAGGVNTLVFSADAAVEPMYSKYRVNGKLEKVLKNVELFKEIKEKHFPKSKIITRVSGVKFDDEQNIESMVDFWGQHVDQVSFVAYNPWENVYESRVNSVSKSCSDLWRRMFIWYDGIVNPCDTDYKSALSVGKIQDLDVSKLWLSEKYKQLREEHHNNKRGCVNPCNRCTVV